MVHPVQQANEGGNGGATMPRLSSASMRSTSSISSSEYPIQASTLGRPSLVQNQPQMYRQSSATPPSSLGSRQSTPPSQYGVMTRPSARPPSPPLPPPPMQQQSLPQVINIFSIFIKLLKNKSNILTGFFLVSATTGTSNYATKIYAAAATTTTATEYLWSTKFS